jgi:hypothetical protein
LLLGRGISPLLLGCVISNRPLLHEKRAILLS